MLEIERREPELLLARAWVHYYQCQLPKLFETVERLGKMAATVETAGRSDGELSFFKGCLSLVNGDLEKCEQCLIQARKKTP